VIVATTAGKLQGLDKDGILQFRGIPYARAERFRAAQPTEPWIGVRDATDFGPIAPQNPSPLEAMLGAQAQAGAEDCLVVNVYTPATDDARRPVMVWIHGGAFVAGSGHVPWYDGSNLARLYDVVVVSLNYRLGALGFLQLGHLDAAFAGSGSNGIADQVHVHDPATAAWVTERFLDVLRLSPAGADGLLAVPVDDILRAQATVDAEVQAGGGPGIGRLAFQPVVDSASATVPLPPLDAVRAGSAAGVHLIAGTTADEWNLFQIQARSTGNVTPERIRRRLARVVGDERVDDTLDAYRAARPAGDLEGWFCAAMTDWVFRMPAIRLVEAQAPHAPRVSMYRFDYPSTAFGGVLGACHAIDIPFIFANLDRGGVDVMLGDADADTRRLSGRASRAWAAAARTGSPEHDDLPWPGYDTERRATCLLDREPTVADDPEGHIRELWDEVAPVPSSTF
jgi:para-nitrobenzyl esterase